MISRILIAIVVGIITALVTYGLGIILTLLPVVGPVGEFLKAVSAIVGVIAGIFYFVNQRRLV